MKVLFLRHGQTKLNSENKLNGQIDEPLSPKGFEQARAAGLIVPKTVKHIYASSMLRAIQTAEVVSIATDTPISTHDQLREIDMGSIAGRSWTDPDLGNEFKVTHRSMKFDYRKYGGESSQQFISRVVGFVKEINSDHEDYEALIIAHGGVQRLFQLLEQGTENLSDIDNAVLLKFDLNKIVENEQKLN